jgi:hypothetical protein
MQEDGNPAEGFILALPWSLILWILILEVIVK